MKYFDLVKRYLDEEMSAAEQQAFERRLEEEEGQALKRELEMQRIERAAIRLKKEDRLRSILQEVEEEVDAESSGARVRKFNFRSLLLAAAASIAILLAGGYFVLQYQYSDQALALSSYNFSVDKLKGTGGQAGPLARGKALFEEGRYPEAIDAFTQTEGLPVQSRYLIGHAYFKMENYEQALSSFAEVAGLGTGAGDFEDDAKWFWLLSKLALGQTDADFQATLQELSESRDPRALQLEKQLDSFFR